LVYPGRTRYFQSTMGFRRHTHRSGAASRVASMEGVEATYHSVTSCQCLINLVSGAAIMSLLTVICCAKSDTPGRPVNRFCSPNYPELKPHVTVLRASTWYSALHRKYIIDTKVCVTIAAVFSNKSVT
jgi:hypothetical protein